MKNFKRLIAVTLLTFVISITTFGGEIPTAGVIPTCPPNTTCTNSSGEIPTAGVTGEIPAPGATQAVVPTLDPVTEAALSLLQSLLALF